MTTSDRGTSQSQPRTEQGPRHGHLTRQRMAGLLGPVALAVLVILFAAGCGHHFHVTFHAVQLARCHVMSRPGVLRRAA
jgi:hypothetical protein